MRILQQDTREWWLLVSVLVFTKLTLVTTMNLVDTEICPPPDIILPCTCGATGSEVQIWCSYSGLPSVMEAVKTLAARLQYPVDEMILESNNLPSLPGKSFEGLDITRLMLRDNGLERVTSNWLGTLENSLLELFIIEPRLRTLPNDALDHLRRLEAITLQGGLMKRTPRFSSLHKLRYIQIHSPVLLDLIPENFEDLPSLEQLHVMGSPLLNKLDAGLFKNLHKLTILNISNTGLSWIHPKSLINLPSLRELILTGNRLSDAGVVGRVCRDLHHLQILRMDNNFVDRITEGSFVDLPSLREIYLSGNMISEIHRGAFRNMPSLKILDLNRNILRRVNSAAFIYPSGSSLEELWMTDNHLYHVNEMRSLFNSLPRLRFLDMSRNYMEEIPFDLLRGHPTLERLHLDENRIKRIPRKAFSGMLALRELRLKNNSISDFLDGPSWNLPSLKGLDLSQNKIRKVDSRLLTYLPSLRRLDLSENYIDTVLADSFIGNLELETLNLSKNFIPSFHVLTFSHLPNLFEIDAGYNRLREVIPGLPKNVEHLRLPKNQIVGVPNNLDLPALRLLDLSGNTIQAIQQDTFRTMSRLQWLYLNDNSLENIESGAFNGLLRLEVLNMRNNRIREFGPSWMKGLKELKEMHLQGNYLERLTSDALHYNSKLRSLYLENNKLTEVYPGAFSNARDLQELNLSHNSLSRMPEALENLPSLHLLDVSYNQIRSIQPFQFGNLPSLTELHISNNKLQEIAPNTFKDLSKLEYLDLNNNELEQVSSGAFRSLPSLIAIRLSVNRLTKLPQETFVDLPQLQSAELQSNNLQEISEHAFVSVPHLALLNLSSNLLVGLDRAGIKELRSLEVLDMSHNKISWLEGRSFSGMDWLVELKMDHNNLCNIRDAPFNGLSRLRVLSLKHNRMTTVTEAVFQRLRSNVAVLDIDGNPLTCSCKMLWLQSWLKDTDSEGPRCADGTLFREARLSRTECASSRIVEPIIPGCESETIHGSVVETSQLSSLISDPKNNTQGPLPHESEYFYDEYVEYQYEEVNTTDASNSTEATLSQLQSSHTVSGDTPTIYARPIPQINLTNPGLGFNDLKKAQQQQSGGYNGLTFFGIPLPSLSLGNLWKGSTGRSAEQSQGRTPFPKGKVQLVSKQFETKNNQQFEAKNNQNFEPKNNQQFGTKNNQSKFSTPEIEMGGFVPVVQTNDDFMPMVKDFPEMRLPSQQTTIPTYVDKFPSEETVRFPEDNSPQSPKNFAKIEPVKKQGDSFSIFGPVEVSSEKPYKVFTNTEIIIPAENESNPFPIESTEIKDYSNPVIDVPKRPLTEKSYSDFYFESASRNYENPYNPSPEIFSNEIPKVEAVSNVQYANVNDWYFQNYNRTDLQPFVGAKSNGNKEFFIRILMVMPIISVLMM